MLELDEYAEELQNVFDDISGVRLDPELPQVSRQIAIDFMSLFNVVCRKRPRSQGHSCDPGRHSKRSMWVEIQLHALACSAMWACCDDTSSDDGEHNTSDAFLLFCADRPHRAGASCRDELKVALGCRFSLHVFTVAQQDHPLDDQDSVNCGLGPVPAFWR